MSIAPFNFSSDNLPKLKAKQLSKAFPFLKLAAAQEATARALGYPSWYTCTRRGTQGVPSLSDQEAGLPVRVARYYAQVGVLMGLGITPAEADLWVRAWGLTGQPTLSPQTAQPVYSAWNDALERFERGEIDENQLVEECGDGGYSKHPDIDRPQRVCPGVILGPMGKYPHYAVAQSITARIPIYLRGPNSLYHYEDDGDVLATCIPEFPRRTRSAQISPSLSRIQHEWHYGEKHPDARAPCIPNLVSLALVRPDALVVISQRAMPKPGYGFDFTRCAMACLRGVDFARFLQSKGEIDPSTVIWYSDVDLSVNSDWMDWGHWLAGFQTTGPEALPIFEAANKYQPCLPVYSYPFMSGPMSPDEYGLGVEHACLLPLGEDYDEDDAGGDHDAPEDPFPPVPGRAFSALQLA